MIIFKICHRPEWEAAASTGAYRGSAKDVEDGFLHFSTAAQLPGTLARYYANAHDLVLAAADAEALGHALRFEPSSGGDRYPHLYADLPLSAVRWVKSLKRAENGGFLLPSEVHD